MIAKNKLQTLKVEGFCAWHPVIGFAWGTFSEMESSDILLSLADFLDDEEFLESGAPEFEIYYPASDDKIVEVWQEIGWSIKPCTMTLQSKGDL